MMNKLITFKIFFRSLARLLFFFIVSDEDKNMTAKKAWTSLYFPFLMFFYKISWLESSLAMQKAWVRYDLI